jgi:hippurate hydrolase
MRLNAIEEIAAFQNELRDWRRDIHAHPELGFEEMRTSDIVAAKLESFGLEVHRGIGKTGIVASLRVGNSPRAIGLRADMDALPIHEENAFDHRSRHDGKMHACGHDGHTTMLLGAARHLCATRNFEGCVHFIFQPAEEGLGGAMAMIQDGLFEQFPMESIYGMHNLPGLEAGRFSIRPGPMMAGAAFFDIQVTGVGAHAAWPERSVDPVVAAAHMVTALQTIVARNARSTDAMVVSVTKIHSGEAYNVIPQSARLGGTVRCFSNDVMRLAEDRMRQITENLAEAFGAKATLDFRPVFVPLVNTPDETQFCADVAAGLVGEENVNRSQSLIMGSEDFSFMLEKCPGAYIRIGNGADPNVGMLHNPSYDFNDEILALGASYWVRLVEAKLAKEALTA